MTVYRLKTPTREDEGGNRLIVIDGVRYFIDPGTDYDEDHPAVSQRKDMFYAPNIEQATKAPGERRTTKRKSTKKS
jgi:hypothetical protein